MQNIWHLCWNLVRVNILRSSNLVLDLKMWGKLESNLPGWAIIQKQAHKKTMQTLVIVSIFDMKCWFFLHGCFFLGFLGSFFHLWQVVFKISSVLLSRFSRTCIVCIFAPRTKETWKKIKNNQDYVEGLTIFLKKWKLRKNIVSQKEF